ncbi:MAG: hypothetical protein IJ465_05020, partial [Clostridia bacterium]|nr:hypothetical protein [Clostridia bacterium]
DAWEYIGTKQIEIDLTEYVKNTDYASVGKCGIVKTAATYDDGIYINTAGAMSLCTASTANIDDRKTKRPITPTNLDYAVKVGITTNTNELTTDEQAAALAWLGAVGTADYAGYKKPGLVELLPGGAYGIDYLYGNVTSDSNALKVVGATNADIDGGTNQYKPIVPSNLGYAVKVGLTTNTETLTEEEKSAAQLWLGMNVQANEAKPWSVVKRSTDGAIVTGTPTANNHATTKAYVDNLVGDVETALDCIIAIQDSLIVGTITFMGEYTALAGMTFGEWVNSRYNTIGAEVTSDNNIYWPADVSTLAVQQTGEHVLATDVISESTEYEWV